MTEQEIRAIFFSVFKGHRNIMTPSVVEFGEAGDLLYELSTSDKLWDGMKPYGITVLTRDGQRRDDISVGMINHDQARLYIAALGAQ